MTLTEAEAFETRGYLRAKGLSVEGAAELMDRHRTTFYKKLRPAGEISPIELIELGEKIARRSVKDGA